MITLKNPQFAFEKAIKEHRLSVNPHSKKYAGNYMYMGTDEQGKDLFKNSLYRNYID